MTTQTDIESAIIGSILISGQDEGAAEIFLEVQPFHFDDKKHKGLFTILKSMREEGKIIDLITVGHEVMIRNLNEIYTMSFLSDMMEKVSTTAHIKAYISLLKRNSYLREIRNEILRLNPNINSEDVDRLMSLIQMRDNTDKKMVVSPNDFILDYVKDLKTKKSSAIITGFYTLDRNLHSQAGDLIVVGARTNVGKTTYLTNILINMLNYGIPCLYAATEMRPKQFMDRVSPLISDVSAYNFRSREFTDDEVLELDKIGNTILKMPLKMLDIAGPNIQEISQAVKTSGCKVLFLDYLGRCSMPKENTRMREIEKFVVSLKNLCVDKGILCFLAVQLSRATDYNKDSEPRLADLADSSAIEKEADAVVFLWKDSKNNSIPGTVISAILAKNRHGLLANWNIDFEKRRMKMTEQGYLPKEKNYNEPKDTEDLLPL